jgi:hypothetical protein
VCVRSEALASYLYQSGTWKIVLEESQREVDQVEDMVKLKCKQTSDEDILEQVRGWLHDPLYSCTRETKFFKTMELYWHVKAMVAQTLEKCMVEQTKILHTIEIFQGKFELMCQSAYGIKFKVLKASSYSGPSKPLVDGLASIGNRDCPITIDKSSIDETRFLFQQVS